MQHREGQVNGQAGRFEGCAVCLARRYIRWVRDLRRDDLTEHGHSARCAAGAVPDGFLRR